MKVFLLYCKARGFYLSVHTTALQACLQRRCQAVWFSGYRTNHWRIGIFFFVFVLVHTLESCPGGSIYKPEYARGFEICKDEKGVRIFLDDKNMKRASNYLILNSLPNRKLLENEFLVSPKRVALVSTTYVEPFLKLEIESSICALGRIQDVKDTKILQMYSEKKIIGFDILADQNLESLILSQPEIVFTYFTGSESEAQKKMKMFDMKTVEVSEYKEVHPLGYAEWLVFFAAFFNRIEQAKLMFMQIKNEYNALSKQMLNVDRRPTVMLNLPYNGVWHIPGSSSFIVKMIQDAGGAYLFSRIEGAYSVPKDFETVFLTASDADIWINPSLVNSFAELVNIDSRYALFAPFQSKQIYNHTKKENYFEKALANPHLLLKDLIAIFHPEAFPGYQTVWYEKLR